MPASLLKTTVWYDPSPIIALSCHWVVCFLNQLFSKSDGDPLLSLSHSVALLGLDWCDPGVLRFTQLLKKSRNLFLPYFAELILPNQSLVQILKLMERCQDFEMLEQNKSQFRSLPCLLSQSVSLSSCWILFKFDWLKLLHGFVKIDTWISLNCYMDSSKLLHWFIKVIMWTKVNLDQDFKAC